MTEQNVRLEELDLLSKYILQNTDTITQIAVGKYILERVKELTDNSDEAEDILQQSANQNPLFGDPYY